MWLNLNDPDSIIDWWKVFPERHDGFLDYKLIASPEFAPAIHEAQRRISGSPELSGLLAAAVQRRHLNETYQVEHEGNSSVRVLRRREAAMA